MNRSQTLYQPQAEDMSIEADVYQFGLLGEKTSAQRFAIGAHLIRWSRQISFEGFRKRVGSKVQNILHDRSSKKSGRQNSCSR